MTSLPSQEIVYVEPQDTRPARRIPQGERTLRQTLHDSAGAKVTESKVRKGSAPAIIRRTSRSSKAQSMGSMFPSAGRGPPEQFGHPPRENTGGTWGHLGGWMNKASKVLTGEGQHSAGYDPEFENPRQKTERYRQERNEARENLDILLQQNTELRKQIEEKQQKVESTKRAAQQMQLHLDSKELFLGHQATDDQVRADFEGLLGSIRTWALRLNNPKPSTTTNLREQYFDSYRQIAPMCRSMDDVLHILSDPKSRRFFVRGLVVYTICNTLFRTLPSEGHYGSQVHDVWIDKSTSENFYILENRLYRADRRIVSYQALNDWRAFTAELLSKFGVDQKLKSEIEILARTQAKAIMDALYPWCNPDTAEQTLEGLCTIFLDAIKLAQFLRRQRACWSVRFPITTSDVLFFDPASMKDNSFDDDDEDQHPLQSQQQYVELVVTPGLWKRGDEHGEHFEVENPVSKATVLVFKG